MLASCKVLAACGSFCSDLQLPDLCKASKGDGAILHGCTYWLAMWGYRQKTARNCCPYAVEHISLASMFPSKRKHTLEHGRWLP